MSVNVWYATTAVSEGVLNKQKLFHANLRMYPADHILLFINTRFREQAECTSVAQHVFRPVIVIEFVFLSTCSSQCGVAPCKCCLRRVAAHSLECGESRNQKISLKDNRRAGTEFAAHH